MLTYEWLQQVRSHQSIQTSTYFSTKKSAQIPDGSGLIQTGDLEGETIDVSQINEGIFFLTIYTKDNKIRTEKIIKN